MNLHEYQSKDLMAAYELPVLQGFVCYTPGEVEAAYDNLAYGKKGAVCVIKAQVHAGGRGKAGGVKLVRSSEEAREAAKSILGMTLITPQTGEKGKFVKKVYVEAGCDIDKEYYLSFLVDRAAGTVSIVASTEGGTEIEEVAEKSPQKIITVSIDPRVGLRDFQTTSLAFKLGLKPQTAGELGHMLQHLYEMFINNDLSLLEINPLVLTKDGSWVILDAKCSIDDNALYRHAQLREMRDYDEEDAKDLAASKHGLSYVALDGSIACMVNGAGLAMATMDIIKNFGGKPANFLDVGGGATREKVTEAFKILLSDANVKGILVNIFGGIMKCDVIAQGIVEAAQELSLKVPLVVRLQGTNVELGKKILADSGLTIIAADTMADAATKIIEATR
jgi:succinyl-CoA synthetase beta subunit